MQILIVQIFINPKYIPQNVKIITPQKIKQVQHKLMKLCTVIYHSMVV